MTGNQWQYVVVFVLLVAIVVWICYNLFSKKRRSRMSQCSGCLMSDACRKEFRSKVSGGNRSCHKIDRDPESSCCCRNEEDKIQE